MCHRKDTHASKCHIQYTNYIGGLMQERHNSISNTLELCLSCTNPSTWWNTKSLAAGHTTWIRTRYQPCSCPILTYDGMCSLLPPGWNIYQYKIPVSPYAITRGPQLVIEIGSPLLLILVVQRENYLLCSPLLMSCGVKLICTKVVTACVGPIKFICMLADDVRYNIVCNSLTIHVPCAHKLYVLHCIVWCTKFYEIIHNLRIFKKHH